MVGVPQASVAVAVPNAPFIAAVDGLHPSSSAPPVAVSVGAVISNVHVAVRDVVDVLPQPSIAVHVLVCERAHPLVTTAPSVEVMVGVPQASVAVAVPNAPFIVAVDGLRRISSAPPVAVSVGAVISNVHVAVREVEDVLPQASVAIHVLVCERPQPLLCTAPSVEVTVGVPHASVADAVPNAPFIAAVDGLHPRASALPVAVSVGAVTSNVHVAVRDVVAVLPHTSVAVHVLVCERKHPLLCTAPSVDVTVGVPQLSVADAEPRAALIAAVVGLQPRAPFAGVPVAVIVGAILSLDHCTVRAAVEVLPHASVAVH